MYTYLSSYTFSSRGSIFFRIWQFTSICIVESEEASVTFFFVCQIVFTFYVLSFNNSDSAMPGISKRVYFRSLVQIAANILPRRLIYSFSSSLVSYMYMYVVSKSLKSELISTLTKSILGRFVSEL